MRTTSSRLAYENPWIRVREDLIEREDGSAGLFGVVERPDFALVLAAERDGFWLVEQFRYALGRRSWEFPQGTGGQDSAGRPKGGSAEELARAELVEGTGISAGSLRRLGHLDLAPGLTTQGFDIWLATELTAGPPDREASESDMRSAFVAEDALRAMLADGRFTDGPSLAAFGLLLLDRG